VSDAEPAACLQGELLPHHAGIFCIKILFCCVQLCRSLSSYICVLAAFSFFVCFVCSLFRRSLCSFVPSLSFPSRLVFLLFMLTMLSQCAWGSQCGCSVPQPAGPASCDPYVIATCSDQLNVIACFFSDFSFLFSEASIAMVTRGPSFSSLLSMYCRFR
jgi:hypothetical protein